jgi:hypothetical protein
LNARLAKNDRGSPRCGICNRDMTMRDDHKPEYGTDAVWPNVVWTIIGILCACGLVALPFMG